MTTYKEIKRQFADLERKAELARKAELTKIIAGIKHQIKEYELTAEDLFGGKAKAKPAKTAGAKKVYPPKYQAPKTKATWTGLGRPPEWIKDAIAKGKKDDFLISSAGPKKAAAAKKAPAAEKWVRESHKVKLAASSVVAADAS